MTCRRIQQVLKNCFFANVAAVRGIVLKTGNLQFVHHHDFLTDAFLSAEFHSLRQIPSREHAALCGHRQQPVPQLLMGNLQQKGRIHPAGKRHRQGAQVPQVLPQLRFLLL